MITTHEYLVNEPGFSSRLLSSVEQYSYPGCLELRWDAPVCGVMTEDTGIALKDGSRFVVLSLLRKQLRYYAASEDVTDIDYEVGILPDANHAFRFVEDYLLRRRPLLAILIPRRILRAQLEAQGDRVIGRPNTDMQAHHSSRK